MLATSVKNRIGIITLNRPEKRNAFNPELILQIKEAMDVFNIDDDIRAILIQANGEAFSAGADLTYIKSLRSNTLAENEKDSMILVDMFESIYNSPKLTFSAVDGYALAGGCGLALLTDFCLATVNAKFGFTEARIGFIPAIVSVYMLKKFNAQLVRQLMLEAAIYDAEQAKELGMISKLFTSADFQKQVMEHIGKQIKNTSGDSIKLTKELLRNIEQLSHRDALTLAAQQNAKARSSADCIKGMDSFLNKSKINW